MVSSDNLIQKANEVKPTKLTFVKDAPVLGYQIKSDKFEDIPEAIRKHLGAVDKTKYTPEYLKENIGSVIALQMNGDKPDFYIIGKDTYDKKYKNVPYAEVAQKNAKYFGRVSSQISGIGNPTENGVVAMLKTTPTEMIRMSELGYAANAEVKIQSPWGEQTKPAGQDAFLVWDDGKKQYYMVNADAQGKPLSYVDHNVPQSQESSTELAIRRESARLRTQNLDPGCLGKSL
jgi:hypothetical protein